MRKHTPFAHSALRFLFLIGCGYGLCFQQVDAQTLGFAPNDSIWPLPDGGKSRLGLLYGFYWHTGYSDEYYDVGSPNWQLQDLDGDNLTDLVLVSANRDSVITCYNAPTDPHWKVYRNTGTQFELIPLHWTLPFGGLLENGDTLGFFVFQANAGSTSDDSSMSWKMIDMNADQRPDLVVTGEKQAGRITSFSPDSSQYWKVYYNNGSGFDTIPSPWPLPDGGYIRNGIQHGFFFTSGSAPSLQDSGSQSWNLEDLNGDHLPDLVLTAEHQNGITAPFSINGSPHWKVHWNLGTAFDTNSADWPVPQGGQQRGGGTFIGFNYTVNIAQVNDDSASQSYLLRDLNNDQRPDLVVTAELIPPFVQCYPRSGGYYWKVFFNNGAGFDTTWQQWNLPAGGMKYSGQNYGFHQVFFSTDDGYSDGSQNWNLMDLEHDGFPDLVVTGKTTWGDMAVFNPTTTPHWKIFHNNGLGFDLTPVQWTLPFGGYRRDGTLRGYTFSQGVSDYTEDDDSQSWVVNDINGDFELDLIVTGERFQGMTTSFSPDSSQYWRVYLNAFHTVHNLEAQHDELEIFPNPTTGRVLLRSGVSFEAAQIQVTDLSGRVVFTQDYASFSEVELDLSMLGNGMYCVVLVGNGCAAKMVGKVVLVR